MTSSMINESLSPPSSDTEDVLAPLGVSVAQAAKSLNCSPTTIYGLIKDGHLKAYNLSEGGNKRVLVHSIYEFANSGGVGVENQVPAGVRITRNTLKAGKKWG
jgi:excisionase family DNA binding protein